MRKGWSWLSWCSRASARTSAVTPCECVRCCSICSATRSSSPRPERSFFRSEKGLELAVMVQPGLREDVRGDPVRVRQVLLNLLSNAVKFTETGEVVLRAWPEPADPASHECAPKLVRFEVTDTGVGIDATQRSLIFESFTQADSSTTRSYGGTGLGLAISKQLVELMGGQIGVESEVGRGSTFWFTCRLEPGESVSATAKKRKSLRGVHVLVVDDNHTNRVILEQNLAGWTPRAPGS